MTLDGISQTPSPEQSPNIVPGKVEAVEDPSTAALNALKSEEDNGSEWVAKNGASDVDFGNKPSNGDVVNKEGLWNQKSNIGDESLKSQVEDAFSKAPETTPSSETNDLPQDPPTNEKPLDTGDSIFKAENKTEIPVSNTDPLPNPETFEVPDTVTDEMVKEVEESATTPEERIDSVETEWQKKMRDIIAETDSILADLAKKREDIENEYGPRINGERQKAEDANAEAIRLENEKQEKLGSIEGAEERAKKLKSVIENSERPESLAL